MKKLVFIILIPIFCFSQKYKASNCEVTFFSSAPLEDIKANSDQLQGIVDFSTGEFFFRIPIKSFSFKRWLMQKHFNDTYMDSDAIPNSIFKGKSSELHLLPSQNFKTDTKSFLVKGELLIHGVGRDVDIEVFIIVKDEEIVFSSEFFVRTDDYNIKIPKLLKDNISEKIQVNVSGELNPF